MSETLSPQSVTASVLAVAPRVGSAEPVKPAPPLAAEASPAQAETTAQKPPTDRAGRAFDATHFRSKPDGSPFVNANGYFMPRGGRKPKAATPGAPASAPVQSSPAVPAADPWTSADRAAAATPPPVAQPGEPAASPAQGAPPPVGSSSSTAEVGCRALYAVAGVVTGTPEKAVPPTAEHKNYVEAVTQYIDYRGWRFVGGLALVVMGLAYVLRLISLPEVKKSLREKYGWGEPEPRNVTPEKAPAAESEPPPQPPAAAPTPPPAAPEPVMFTKPFVPPAL